MFSLLFACEFVDLMQIPRNKFACKFQGILGMGQKVIIRFLWESGLSSASRNHLTTFCRPFVHSTCLRSCSAVVHFIRNHCLYIVCEARTQGEFEVNPHFSLTCYKNFITCEKEINCFRILFSR